MFQTEETEHLMWAKKPAAPIWVFLLALTALLCAAACGPSKEQVVAEKITERVKDFRKKEAAKCREALLRDAENIADSLLLEEAKAALGDSLAALRPFKPPKPVPVPPIDSLSVAPIFQAASSTRGKQ
jgi:hypothetical protein